MPSERLWPSNVTAGSEAGDPAATDDLRLPAGSSEAPSNHGPLFYNFPEKAPQFPIRLAILIRILWECGNPDCPRLTIPAVAKVPGSSEALRFLFPVNAYVGEIRLQTRCRQWGRGLPAALHVRFPAVSWGEARQRPSPYNFRRRRS